MIRAPRLLFCLAFATLAACSKPAERAATAPPAEQPSILLVTLDTTRADAVGPDAKGVETPAFNALAARGRLFRQAYATVPQTLPSHGSMLTGLYPGGHGVHENARYFAPAQTLVQEQLKSAGYRTAAFVSAFALSRRFGLGRGFDVYDEEEREGQAERTAAETTARVLSWLDTPSTQPTFLWVHYYDAHYPYTPPEPYGTRYANAPYLGEVATVDEQLGRVVKAFEQRARGPVAIVVVADHGEGLGEHGEQQHGNLLYQSTMHVPFVIAGPGVAPSVSDAPVSTRRIYHTILDWAGLGATNSLRGSDSEVVMAEAMKPFLDYGWQPQVMALEGRLKTILAGSLEVYDVIADPGETRNLAATGNVPRGARAALQDYPIPNPAAAAQGSGAMSDEERRKLASLGYVSSDSKPVVRKDAPRAADMASLFPILDDAAALFVREQYAQAIPLLREILSKDPHNLDAALRLATSYSSLGRDAEAVAAFQQAQRIAPESQDVRTYLALHYARGSEWPKAVPLLEEIVAKSPDRLPALEALATVRQRQGRLAEALALRQNAYKQRAPKPQELVALGAMAMEIGNTAAAIDSFERARAAQGAAFRNDLELGVLYLAAGRREQARDALDRVASDHPAYPLALFKRAQVSVLLGEQDRASRIDAARKHANATTRPLIERERLFQ